MKRTKKNFYSNNPSVAQYKIKEGSEIVIEPNVKADIDSIRLFLLGTCMGILLQQRNIFCLHASGVVNNMGKAILFMGKSGAGKSTICRYLVEQGYSYIGDDFIPIIRNEQRKLMAIPSYPHTKLWQSSIDILEVDAAHNRHQIRPHVDKYGFINKIQFHNEPIEVTQCIVLSWAQDNLGYKEINLNQGESVAVYRYQTYRYRMTLLGEEEKSLFNHCSMLGQNLSILRILRNKSDYYMDKIQKQIEN